MTEKEKLDQETKIWKILQGYEKIYTTIQPTFSFSSVDDSFIMKRELLEKLPRHVALELLSILKPC